MIDNHGALFLPGILVCNQQITQARYHRLAYDMKNIAESISFHYSLYDNEGVSNT